MDLAMSMRESMPSNPHRWQEWEFAKVEVDPETIDVGALTRLLGFDPYYTKEHRGKVLLLPDEDGERYYLCVSDWPQGRLDAALARLDPDDYALREPEPDPEVVALEQLWVADRAAPVIAALRAEIDALRQEVRANRNQGG
jgi:hypothetical protein